MTMRIEGYTAAASASLGNECTALHVSVDSADISSPRLKHEARRFVMKNDAPILFLDIDGVMLWRRQANLLDAFELAPGCLEFLEWAAMRNTVVSRGMANGRGLEEGTHLGGITQAAHIGGQAGLKSHLVPWCTTVVAESATDRRGPMRQSPP
jgi:hypothetical protein